MANTKNTEAAIAAAALEVPGVQDKLDVEVVPAKDVNVRESIFIPKGDANDDPNLTVIINGKVYQLPKGKTSHVPKAVYDEIMRSRRAEEAQDTRVSEMVEKAVKEAQNLAQKVAL